MVGLAGKPKFGFPVFFRRVGMNLGWLSVYHVIGDNWRQREDP